MYSGWDRRKDGSACGWDQQEKDGERCRIKPHAACSNYGREEFEILPGEYTEISNAHSVILEAILNLDLSHQK